LNKYVKGPDLANLIKEDKANIGFSWRGFANIKPKTSNGIMEVATPLRAITYDVVSSPSHGSARILSFLNESQSIENIRDLLVSESNDEILLESMDSIIFESENYHFPDSSKEECSKYVKSLLLEHFNSLKLFSLKI
jgi:hypothetical protein